MPTPLTALALLLSLFLGISESGAAEADDERPDRRHPDYARELRHAVELRHGTLAGEPIELEADGRRFLNLYTEPDEPGEAAVIILHGRGLHPNWPAVVQPLRVGLAQRGWATLAMQMPVLEKGSSYPQYHQIFPDAMPRLEAGVRHLRRLGFQRIHLIAHSCGAQMTMFWLDNGGGKGIDSLTVISLGMARFTRQFGHRPPLNRLEIPVLDIYGSRDFVAKRAAERWQMIRTAGNPLSRQVVIEGGKHMLKRHNDRLVEITADWLLTLDR